MGRLTRDPELRRGQSGSPFATFTVAVNRRWKAEDGTPREEIAYVPCLAFGRPAEWAAEHRKGESVILAGRLRTDSRQDKDSNEARSGLAPGGLGVHPGGGCAAPVANAPCGACGRPTEWAAEHRKGEAVVLSGGLRADAWTPEGALERREHGQSARRFQIGRLTLGPRYRAASGDSAGTVKAGLPTLDEARRLVIAETKQTERDGPKGCSASACGNRSDFGKRKAPSGTSSLVRNGTTLGGRQLLLKAVGPTTLDRPTHRRAAGGHGHTRSGARPISGVLSPPSTSLASLAALSFSSCRPSWSSIVASLSRAATSFGANEFESLAESWR